MEIPGGRGDDMGCRPRACSRAEMNDAPSPAAAPVRRSPGAGTRPLSTLRLWGRLLTRRSIPFAHGLEHYGIEAAEGAREAGPTAAQGPPPRAAPARERGATPAGGAGRGSGPRRHRRRPTAGGVAVAASVGRSPGAAVARQTARPQSRAVISAAIRDSGASRSRGPPRTPSAACRRRRSSTRSRQDLAARGADGARAGEAVVAHAGQDDAERRRRRPPRAALAKSTSTEGRCGVSSGRTVVSRDEPAVPRRAASRCMPAAGDAPPCRPRASMPSVGLDERERAVVVEPRREGLRVAGGMCSTTAIGTGKSAGSALRSRVSACGPPVEAPMTTMPLRRRAVATATRLRRRRAGLRGPAGAQRRGRAHLADELAATARRGDRSRARWACGRARPRPPERGDAELAVGVGDAHDDDPRGGLRRGSARARRARRGSASRGRASPRRAGARRSSRAPRGRRARCRRPRCRRSARGPRAAPCARTRSRRPPARGCGRLMRAASGRGRRRRAPRRRARCRSAAATRRRRRAGARRARALGELRRRRARAVSSLK